MKKALIICLLGLLNLKTQAKENTNHNSIIEINSINEVKNYFMFPNVFNTNNYSEQAKVVFTINENGNVDLVLAETDNKILKKSIEEQFLKLKFNHLSTNNTYTINFKFKSFN
jgi:hypothetical protein